MKTSVSISLKLVVVVTLCLSLMAIGFGFITLDFFKNDAAFRAKKDMAFTTQLVGQDLSRELSHDMHSMVSLSEAKDITLAFNAQKALLSYAIYKPSSDGSFNEFYFNTSQLVTNEFGIAPASLSTLLFPVAVKAVEKKPNELVVINSSLILKKPILTIAFFNEQHWLLKSEIAMSTLQEFLKAKDGQSIFVVDADGIVVGSANPQSINVGINVSNSGIISYYKGSQLNSGQLNYIDDQGQNSVGAFSVLPSGLAVIVQAEEQSLYASSNHLRYREMLIALMVLGFAWIVTVIYASQITAALHYLYGAFTKVAGGNFFSNMEVVSGDEIGGLALGFKKMLEKLQERDRLKSTLRKFSNPEDSEKVLSGDIKLSLEKRRMTLLFIELFDFALEELNPEESYSQLNIFWNELANIARKYLGFIDKSDPQEMRVVWGALGHVNDEGVSCLAAALEMRKAVLKFNERRESKHQSPIKLGMAVHTGEMSSGFFGAEGRSEYTFTGLDAFLVKRLVHLNEELESDILVSEDTQTVLKSKGFVFGPSIQGRDSTLICRQVIGRKKSDGEVETDLSRAEQETIKASEVKPTTFNQVATQIHGSPSEQVTVIKTQSHGNSPLSLNTQSHYNFAMGTEVANMRQPTVELPQNTNSFIFSSNAAPKPEASWYLMRSIQSAVPEGPFTLDDLRRVAEQPGFQILEAYAYKIDDTMMTPLMQVQGLSRRQSAPPIPSNLIAPPTELLSRAEENDWLIQREDGQVYGPYTQVQLMQFMDSGQMNRTTYCWRKGMSAWIYAFQMPGLDRRGATPPPPPLPIPSKAG